MLASRLQVWFTAAALVVALLVSGCGDDSESDSPAQDSGSSGVGAVEQRVAAAEKPNNEFEAPGPAFPASEAKGSTIWLIAPLSIPFVQQQLAGMKEAASEVGVEVVDFDGKAQVNDYVRGIRQAIAQKADLIMIESLPVSLFASELGRAEAAGIPVVSIENHDPGPPLPDDPSAVVASVDQCHACAGRMMADFAIADSEGDAEVGVVWSSDVAGIGKPQVDAIKQQFAEDCPDCTVEVIDAPLAQWSTRLGSLTRSTLVANPTMDYLLPLYDGMVSFMLPAVTAANAADRVKIASFNATPAVMQELKAGSAVAADAGLGNTRLGWAVIDQALRVLTDTEPVADPKVPLRLFTASNIDSIDLDAPEQTWYGDPDVWRDGYSQLWELSG